MVYEEIYALTIGVVYCYKTFSYFNVVILSFVSIRK